jgi:hypothetical protein
MEIVGFFVSMLVVYWFFTSPTFRGIIIGGLLALAAVYWVLFQAIPGAMNP